MGALNFHLRTIKSSPSAVALAFSLWLVVAESYVFSQSYVSFLRAFLPQPFDGAREFFHVGFSFAALFFFVRSTLISSFRWQCVYFAVFALALSVEYGFHGALGRFTLPGDVENTFYASDTSDKFGAITLFFSPLIVAPLVVFRLLFRLSPDDASGGAGLFAFNLAFLFTGFFISADFYRQPLPTSAFAAHFNNLTMSALYLGETKLKRVERLRVAPIENAAPHNNVVFIVDESVRADHLSINGYGRATTPTLENLEKEGLLKNWDAGVSGATESVGSNRLLLTGLNELPDRGGNIRRLPTIFQYARAAGYRTFYFDGQDYSGWIGSDEDRRDFGRVFTARDFPEIVEPFDLDRAFAAKIREIVGSSKGNFIWVNKRGAHFRYEKNYPADKTAWSPTAADSETVAVGADASQALANNYDNAIFYNSELFFRTLIGNRMPERTVFVYTSDHGQTLLPDRATHAGDSKTEATVPIFIIGDDERLRRADAGYAAAHPHLFATLLDLMNYPKALRAHEYAPSLLEAKAADSKPRAYFVGNPSGAFGGKKMLFDEPGK